MITTDPRTQRLRPPSEADIPSVQLDPEVVRAVILDADGVLTESQPLRTTAWQDTLDAYLAQYAKVTGRPQRPFDAHADLPTHLTGRLDEDNAAALLRAHGRRLDLSTEHLGPSQEGLLHLLVRHQDQRFVELLNEKGVQARTGAARLLLALRAAGIRTAAVSTGRHGGQLLHRAGLVHLVDACVDAEDAVHYRLAGPPEPALYQVALKLLHTAASHAVLLVDTPLGAVAGAAAGFGRTVLISHGEADRRDPAARGLDGLVCVSVGR